MSLSASSPRRLPAELWLVILIPILTVLAGSAMIHVASSFGFTALGDPVVVEAHAR